MRRLETLMLLLMAMTLTSGLAAEECTLELDGESVSLAYQYAVHLSNPNDSDGPVLSRLICTSTPLAKEQLWDWSRFREVFHAEDNQGFYIQFQDDLVIVLGLAGHEENFSSAGYPAIQFAGEISAERVAGTLRTDPAPTAFDDDTEWILAAEVDLVPVPSW